MTNIKLVGNVNRKLTSSKKSVKNVNKMKLAIVSLLDGSSAAFDLAQIGKASMAMNIF